MTDVDPTGAVLVETDGAGVRTLTFNRCDRTPISSSSARG